MLGDLGGFNSAIILFPKYMMALYAAKMYNNSVYEDMLVKKKRKTRQPNRLQRKLKSTDDATKLRDEGLDDDDVQEIIDEAKTMKQR